MDEQSLAAGLPPNKRYRTSIVERLSEDGTLNPDGRNEQQGSIGFSLVFNMVSAGLKRNENLIKTWLKPY